MTADQEKHLLNVASEIEEMKAPRVLIDVIVEALSAFSGVPVSDMDSILFDYYKIIDAE
jgi:hypothetical protein